jgi:hypothetical protein
MLVRGFSYAAGISAVLAASPNAAMANKLPKTAVNYRPKPNGHKKCSTCVLFEPPKSCKNVAGDISPDGWCILWRAK